MGASVVGISAIDSAAQNATVIHHTRTATTTQAGATFGYTMALGKLGAPGSDTKDDLVSCAIVEDDPFVSHPSSGVDVGAGYVFLNDQLSPHPTSSRIAPTNTATEPEFPGQSFGELGLAIGNCRTAGSTNRIFVGGFFRSKSFTNVTPSVFVDKLGSVEIFDVDLQAQSIALLIPPAEPGSDVPIDVAGFGHDIAIADVDGNGIKDLIVGAPKSDEDIGRVFVFFGFEGFDSNPSYRWVGIRPNASDGAVSGQFGAAVDAADLDGDGKAEIVIGRNERIPRPKGPGRAYVVSGAWVASKWPADLNRTHTLPWPAGSDYQILVNPQAPSIDDYGWRVYVLGDLGSEATNNTVLDGLPDIAIHSTTADFVTTPPGNSVVDCGALFVYFNNGSTSGFVKDGVPNTAAGPLELHTPGPNASPQQGARYGRGAARLRWLNGSASSGTLADYLVVGEPDASVTISNPTPTTYTHAGRVFLLGLPLLPNGTNAWATPLVEPGLAASNGIFGAMIVTGDYVGNQSAYPGQQLIISAREWSQPTPAVSAAGRAYSFRPLP